MAPDFTQVFTIFTSVMAEYLTQLILTKETFSQRKTLKSFIALCLGELG
jgi:hypothetical protein